MKLVYIWIESYQCLKNQGYLLNSDYKVEFDSIRKKLKIQRNESLDSVIYGSNIAVTAIVGDNGVGKSTLMDAVRIMLFDQDERKKIKGFLLIEEQTQLYLMRPENYHIDDDIEYEIMDNISKPEIFLNYREFGLIYYSDFLDVKYYKNEYDDGESEWLNVDGYYYTRNRSFFQINISTSWLIKKCNDKLLNFFHKDIERQLLFYNEMKDNRSSLPLKMPKQLSITLDPLEMKIFDEVLDQPLRNYTYKGRNHHDPEGNTDSYIIGLLKTMENYYQKRDWSTEKYIDVEEILRWNIFVTYIYNLLSKRKDDNENLNDYTEVDDGLKKEILFETYKADFSKYLQDLFSSEIIKQGSEDYFDQYRGFYSRIKKVFQSQKAGNFHIKLLIASDSPYYREENLDIWTDKGEFLNTFLCYENISQNVDFLKFSWQMSSGENSLFNIFARLNDALKKSWDTEAIILLLDELDSSFHPRWQQKIISYLTTFLGEVYSEKKFQIIITTHSPVVLSDVPKDNVIFMEKSGSVKRGHEQTFAANISSLYYDSFFMETGSIGDISRNCIINLLKAIDYVEENYKNEKINVSLKEKLQERFFEEQHKLNSSIREVKGNIIPKLIDSIGEPIWKHKIDERLQELLPTENSEEDEIKTRIEKMRQRQGSESVKEFLRQLMEE